VEKSFDESLVINYRVNQFPMQPSRFFKPFAREHILKLQCQQNGFLCWLVHFWRLEETVFLEFPLLRPWVS